MSLDDAVDGLTEVEKVMIELLKRNRLTWGEGDV